jgi:hypothetical protein
MKNTHCCGFFLNYGVVGAVFHTKTIFYTQRSEKLCILIGMQAHARLRTFESTIISPHY